MGVRTTAGLLIGTGVAAITGLIAGCQAPPSAAPDAGGATTTQTTTDDDKNFCGPGGTSDGFTEADLAKALTTGCAGPYAARVLATIADEESAPNQRQAGSDRQMRASVGVDGTVMIDPFELGSVAS